MVEPRRTPPHRQPAGPRFLRTGLTRAGVALGLGVLLVTTACVGTDAGEVQPSAEGATTTTAPPTTMLDGGTETVTGASGGSGSSGANGAGGPDNATGEKITLAFAGDASFEGLEDRLSANPGGLLSAIAPTLTEVDVAMVNLEAAITTGPTPDASSKTFNFRTPPAALKALRAAGVDVITMANNHGMDFGVSGLRQTLAAEESSGMPIVGIGRNEAEAFAPWITEIRGRRLAFFGASDVIDSSLLSAWQAGPNKPGIAIAKNRQRLAAAIAAVRAEVDTVIVFLHWGTERLTCPNDTQPGLAQAMIDAGADVVVGAHSHRLVGGGYKGRAYVHYGLGNFVFKAPSEAGRASGVLRLSVDGRRVSDEQWIPARITNLVPVPLTGAAADAALADWKQLRGCAGLTAEPTA